MDLMAADKNVVTTTWTTKNTPLPRSQRVLGRPRHGEHLGSDGSDGDWVKVQRSWSTWVSKEVAQDRSQLVLATGFWCSWRCARIGWKEHSQEFLFLVGGFTRIFFHFIYGMSSFPLTNSIIFQDCYCTTNQYIYPSNIPLSPVVRWYTTRNIDRKSLFLVGGFAKVFGVKFPFNHSNGPEVGLPTASGSPSRTDGGLSESPRWLWISSKLAASSRFHNDPHWKYQQLRGGLEHFWIFSPIFGMMIQSDEVVFFRGVGIPPIRQCQENIQVELLH